MLVGVVGPIVLYGISQVKESEGSFWVAEHFKAAALILAGLALVALFGMWAEKRQNERIKREWAEKPDQREWMQREGEDQR
jgi:hypothetical protein